MPIGQAMPGIRAEVAGFLKLTKPGRSGESARVGAKQKKNPKQIRAWGP
jgi:hypothetical protein